MTGLPEIDPARLAEEMAADESVIVELAANGDIETLPRTIDIHFKGDREAIERLARDAPVLGFRFIDFGEFEDGDIAADLQVDGPVTRDARTALITRALQIEISHGVEFDGWGCAPETGSDE
ncbi:ribonuclease E inhibitor RraB [Polymorphobacter sp.]|uniref:ribonuclease E inhibitor RraB n=1 Tax=Polymorphobacter sp. TaxID=1909290 RepID=UPI003F727FF5